MLILGIELKWSDLAASALSPGAILLPPFTEYFPVCWFYIFDKYLYVMHACVHVHECTCECLNYFPHFFETVCFIEPGA